MPSSATQLRPLKAALEQMLQQKRDLAAQKSHAEAESLRVEAWYEGACATLANATSAAAAKHDALRAARDRLKGWADMMMKQLEGLEAPRTLS